MLTDFGNEQRMVDAVCGQIKFGSEKKVWYIWNTKIGKWEEDITGKVHEVVKFVFRNIREVEVADMVSRAEKITDEIKRNELKEIAGAYTNFALKCQNPAKIKACLDLCQTNKNFAILSSEFDKNSNLLNFNNGTLNLTTGEFYTHKKDDMITKTVGYDYDSGAKCPKFEAFISSLFDSNKEKDKLVRYLKMAFGLCLTGDTHHQVIQMCVGSGSNGKSALLGSIQQVFGEYGSYLNGDSLTENRKGQIREDIANLEGKRFVYASENTKGSKLDNELLKQLSGGSKDVIQVRRLYGHYFNLYPQCKIFWAFNHAPYISDMTLGLWRRIKIIPFEGKE